MVQEGLFTSKLGIHAPLASSMTVQKKEKQAISGTSLIRLHDSSPAGVEAPLNPLFTL